MAIEVLAVDLRGDPADALAALVRHEDGALGVLEEGVLLRVEALLDVQIDGTDVVGIAFEDPIDHPEEVTKLRPTGPHRALPDVHHAPEVVPFAPRHVNRRLGRPYFFIAA